MIKGKVRLHLNPEYGPVLANTTGAQAFSAMQARLIKLYAYRHFMAMVRHTHPVTPPPYATSFFIERVQLNKQIVYLVGNNDPVAMLIEFGAHPRGGTTEVLGYRPLGHGLDAVINGAT